VPRCVPSTVRINSDRPKTCRKRGAGDYRLIRGMSPDENPAVSASETIDGIEARCSTVATSSEVWVTRSLSICRSNVGPALAVGHDLSRFVVIGQLPFRQRVITCQWLGKERVPRTVTCHPGDRHGTS